MHLVDIQIRRLKEMCRGVLSDPPYTLPKIWINDLVLYLVNRRKTRRTKALNTNICTRVRFTSGRKIQWKNKFQVGFGDYVEARDLKKRSNTEKDHTEPCIALYPS